MSSSLPDLNLFPSTLNNSSQTNEKLPPFDSASASASASASSILTSLVSCSSLGLILADRRQSITHVNAAFERITGYRASDVIGKTCNFLQGKFTDSRAIELLRCAIASELHCRVAILNYRKNGQPFWNLLSVTPMRDKHGIVTNYIGIQHCQSILYVDRPIKMFPWNQEKSYENRETQEFEDQAKSISEWRNSPFNGKSRNSFNRAAAIIPMNELISEPTSSFDFSQFANSEVFRELPAADSIEQFEANLLNDHIQINPKSNKIPNETDGSDAAFDHRFPAVAVSPRLFHSSPVSFVAETNLPTRRGFYRVRVYKDGSKSGIAENRDIVVILFGSVAGLSRVPLRVHDQCFTSEVLGSLKCDCADQLDFAMEFIQANPMKCGIIIYLSQEGRGIGLANKIKAYSLQELGFDTVDANRVLGLPDDLREYNCVPAILADLQVESCQLMTNNPRKSELLCSLGVNVVSRIPVLIQSNAHSDKYLKAKQTRMNHSNKQEKYF